MTTFKLYDVLGIPKSATQDQIRSAYRKLAVKHHPDKGGDAEMFKQVSAANEVLSDQEKRREYDTYGDSGRPQGPPPGHPMGNPMDMFSQFFGGGFPFGMQQPQPTKKDFEKKLHISLRDAYFGCTKTFSLKSEKPCCQTQCRKCNGTGIVTEMIQNGMFTQISQNMCNVCSGKRTIHNVNPNCSLCHGSGVHREEAHISLQIGRGCNNEKIMAEAFGEKVIINLVVDEDEHFKRNGNDLMYTTQISFKESVLGKTVSIPHFNGNIVINTNQFGIIEPNREYILPGQGMHNGNLLVKFNVLYPPGPLTEPDLQLLQNAFTLVKTFV